MKFLTLRGKTRNTKVSRYLVKWDGESKSKFQFRVKQYLRKYWRDDIVTEEFPVTGTQMRMDFVNVTKKIAVEANGVQHSQLHWFHNFELSKYLAQLKRDSKKEGWCRMNGYKLIEIDPNDMPLTKEFFLEKYEIEL